MFFVRTQKDRRKIWEKDIAKVFWEGLTAKAQLHSGEVVTLGIYESEDEADHVAQNFFASLEFVSRYNFPEYGYFKKFYAEDADYDEE